MTPPNDRAAEEQRLYPRYLLRDERLATAEVDRRRAVVGEIGYGGCSLLFEGPGALDVKPGQAVRVVLTSLDRRLAMRANVVSLSGTIMHVRFEHDMAGDLAFLQDIIQWLEAGSAAMAATKGAGSVPARSVAVIAFDHAGRMEARHRIGRVEYAVTLDHEDVDTLLDVAPGAEKGPLRSTAVTDPIILRRTLFLVHGAWLATQDDMWHDVFDKLYEVYDAAAASASASGTGSSLKAAG
jgi:hypothetical protein